MIVTVTDLYDGVTAESSPVTIAVVEGGVGAQGPQGEQGPAGPAGADGESAYEVAVAGGFVGTEAAWLASLVGPEGPQGPAGADGAGVVASVEAPLVLTGDVLSLDDSGYEAAGAVAAHVADVTDAHSIAGVTGLQAALDGKADDADITALDGRVDALEAVDNATQAELDAHVNDATAAHAASAVAFTPAGSIAATDVQAALAELDSEKSAAGHTHTLASVTDAGDSAGLDVGSTAGTVAAGDHTHAGGSGPTIETVRFNSAAGGGYNVTSTSWVEPWGSAADLVIPAVAGDMVQVTVVVFWDLQNAEKYGDVVSIVSAAAVNSWGQDAAQSNTLRGMAPLHVAGSTLSPRTATYSRAVVSGDLSGGNLTLRFQARGANATSRTIFATSDLYFYMQAVNFGQ